MHYIFYFDICAICILLTIAVVSLSRKWVPAYRQRAYGMLFLAVFMATLSERVETYLQMFPSSEPWYHPLEMLSGSVYFVAHLGSGFCYMIYILSVLDIYVDIRKPIDFISVMLGHVIGVVMVIINVFVPVLFHYDENGLYHRDRFLFIYYILATYYMVYGCGILFKYKKLMRRRTKLVILSYVVLVITGIFIQFFYPKILIENLMSALAITLVYISLQNPSEMVDDTLNILNRKAFLEGLDIKTDRKSPSSTIFVTIDNIRALSDEIGYAQAQSVMKKIALYLKRVGARDFRLQTYAYRYSEYVFAVTVHGSDLKRINALLHAIALRLHEPWEFANMSIRVEGHCFQINYPSDYTTTAELITKVDAVVESIDLQNDVVVDIHKSGIDEITKVMDYDVLARSNIDKKSAFVKFQPVLSKVYKINYCADAICFFIDEYGNEIDMRGHIPDKRVSQALLDTDEFVYRKACRALAFWNAGDKNGKYRAIVGMSQGEIARNDLIRRLKKILREERAEASWVSLKLTETTISTMNAVAERNLKLLGEMKCSIVVDKFGSGYGDLDKILDLPVTQVNIDHDIIVKAGESETMFTVASGIVNLFHDISIFVGATDIASEKERDTAEKLGCDFLIGDYMGRPMKDSSFVKYIDAYFEEG
ncbi:GGDEF domain-containing protein [Butyrivibrio sp. CB08]|uniref:EAL domain-containing protein n=1 Tax=Butyrivibrio sp. CB08 TaxID=2364879 RepID=UPI000EAA68BA|nr:EAL domain-containing protein [Butyrivibrio sp. CB08]RKM61283.1 GGDEF domain-containing protein [Butyrivibrio sp. CB08]